MSSDVAGLLHKRLIFVTGKGGVGKTTITAAIGLAASHLGLHTLLVELGDRPEIPHLFGRSEIESDEAPVGLRENLFHLALVPEVALREYLEIQLRVRSIVRLVLRNSGVRRLLEAAPGWRDLIRLGKLWHLETRSEGDAPRWDLLIVDAPATGHGLTLFSIPDAVLETVRSGPLRRHAAAVQSLMHDPARTSVLPVTLPEELSARETVQLIESLEARQLKSCAALANAVHRAPASAELLAALDQLDSSPPGLPDLDSMRARLHDDLDRAKHENEWLGFVRDQVGICLELPRLEPAPKSLDGIEELAARIQTAASPR